MTQGLATPTAARLRAARLAAGLSVTDLALAAHIAETTVYRLESGAHELRHMRVARDLAAALGVSVAHLLDGAAA